MGVCGFLGETGCPSCQVCRFGLEPWSGKPGTVFKQTLYMSYRKILWFTIWCGKQGLGTLPVDQGHRPATAVYRGNTCTREGDEMLGWVTDHRRDKEREGHG